MTGMRFAHVHYPHDSEISRDRTQQVVGGLLLQCCSVLFSGSKRVEYQICCFGVAPVRQESGECATLGNAGNSNTESKCLSEEVLQVVLSAGGYRAVGLIIGTVQHQLRPA